ncbi:unnamed protein product [Mycena citricolor]|uniref:SP-RING-type domain-containing protein n=1 Tax=Mycena citricolor TaxID=2018698 RepID=A0AAD2HZL9_9AGAR|nr:unnamed protein product [Mycena citricolor]
MPVATSRRKRSAQQPSSDIEEDQATQARPADDVDDEDAPRPNKRERQSKRAKGKSAARPLEAMDEEGEEEDEDDRIDINHFEEQPISRADGHKISGLASDWLQLEKVMTQPSNLMNSAAEALADITGGDAEAKLEQLDQVLRESLDIQALMRGNSEILKGIMYEIDQGVEITNAKDLYLERVEKLKDKYDGKTSRQKYATSDQYMEFKEAIFNAKHSSSAMPPITDFIPREDGDESDDDDDVVIGGVTQDFRCPLSLTLLEDPMTSTVCHHSFSGAAVRAMFRTSTRLKCPTAGCSQSFTLAQCIPDPNLARKVKAFEKRQARARRNNDAEEIID